MNFMKRFTTLIRLLSAAALLLTAGCGRNDDRDLLPPPGYASVGSSLSGDSDAQFTSGWHPIETGPDGQSWRWMGRRGEVQLLNQQSEMRLRLRGWAPLELLNAAPVMRVSLNGHELESFTAPQGHFTKTWVIPRAMQGDGEKSTLVIETSLAVKPKGDTRELGYSLIELSWEPRPIRQ